MDIRRALGESFDRRTRWASFNACFLSSLSIVFTGMEYHRPGYPSSLSGQRKNLSHFKKCRSWSPCRIWALPHSNCWLAFIRLRFLPPSTKAQKDKEFSLMKELCSLDGSQTRIGCSKDLILRRRKVRVGSAYASSFKSRLSFQVRRRYILITRLREFLASRSISLSLHLAWNYQKQKRNGSAFDYGLNTSLFLLLFYSTWRRSKKKIGAGIHSA